MIKSQIIMCLQSFTSAASVEALVAEATRKLEEYESTENPEQNGVHKPSSALTTGPKDTVDSTSKFTGMSPESLAVGIVDDRCAYLFCSLSIQVLTSMIYCDTLVEI